MIISFPSSIAPNETSTIEFVFRPNNTGFKQANIVINSNSITDTIVTIPVQARKERISIQVPQSIDIGTVCFGANETININISNIGTLPSTIVLANHSLQFPAFLLAHALLNIFRAAFR